MMIRRFFRHLFTTRAATRRAFPDASLDAIESGIAEGEKTHRAEIRVIIETAISIEAVLSRMTPRERALELFGRYGIWDTEENCGILIYINLADRQVEIVADRGISTKINPDEWNHICKIMTAGFSQGRFHESTLEALSALNQLLAQQVPSTGPHENQLPDHPIRL